MSRISPTTALVVERRDLFSSVLSGLNLLVDTKTTRVGSNDQKGGFQDILIKVRYHEGRTKLHVLKYMLSVLSLPFSVTNSHHYHSIRMRADISFVDLFSCASSVMVGYLELLSNFDNEFRHKFTVRQLLSGWATLVVQKDYESYAKLVKFMCAYPMTRIIRDDPPPLVEGYNGSLLVFRGRLAAYIRQRMICPSRVNQRLMFSILNLKRCCLKMPSTYIYGALKKHRELVTKTCPSISDSYMKQFATRCDYLLESIDLGNMDKHLNIDRIHSFSRSASFTTSRSAGGASWDMFQVANGPTNRFSVPFSFPPIPYTLTDLPADVVLRNMTYTPLQGVKSFYMTYDWTNKSVFRFMESIPEHVQGFEDRPCHARVAAVEEPLKIRTVTCGESIPYMLCTGLQKDLHKTLKAYPQFSLIGEELSHESLGWLFKKDQTLRSSFRLGTTSSEALSDVRFVSGDYTSATDTLNIELSKYIIERIILYGRLHRDWPDDYCNLVRATIYPHFIEYPIIRQNGQKLEEIPPAIQSNGQLMGSILSFPLLCIINLIHYWITVKPEYEFEDLPVLVNGDDILFLATNEEYDRWRLALHEPGFQLSLGKNYFSRELFTINTTLHRVVEVHDRLNFRTTLSYETLDYFPVGKLLGKSKVESPYNAWFKPLWALQEDVIRGAQDPLRAWERFNYYHKDTLNRVTKNGRYNWFISPFLGGLGMHLPEGVTIFTDKKKFNEAKCYKTYITPEQHRLASFMFNYKRNWHIEKFHSANFGVRNDFDKFVCPHHLVGSHNAPTSEFFEPDEFTQLRFPHEFPNLGETRSHSMDLVPNSYHSRGKDHHDDNFTFYDTEIPKHRFRHVTDLVDPELLLRVKFVRYYRRNSTTFQSFVDRTNRFFWNKFPEFLRTYFKVQRIPKDCWNPFRTYEDILLWIKRVQSLLDSKFYTFGPSLDNDFSNWNEWMNFFSSRIEDPSLLFI